jgi:hypothetical protein
VSAPPCPAVRQHGLRLPAPRQAHPTIVQDAAPVAGPSARARRPQGKVRQPRQAQAAPRQPPKSRDPEDRRAGRLTDDEILARLFGLNQTRAGVREKLFIMNRKIIR